MAAPTSPACDPGPKPAALSLVDAGVQAVPTGFLFGEDAFRALGKALADRNAWDAKAALCLAERAAR